MWFSFTCEKELDGMLAVMLINLVRSLQIVKGCQEACNRSAEELLVWLKNGYDGAVRPNITGGPVVIDVEAYISSVSKINEEDMEFSLDMFLRQRWKDARLSYRPLPNRGQEQRIALRPEISKLVWQPDLIFLNSRQARFHMVPNENLLFGISPDGNIILSARITTVLSCQMNFRKFPMDRQTCHLTVSSYTQTEDDVILQWRNGKGIILSNEVEIPQFDLGEVITKTHKGVYNTGVYSEPKATFSLRRRLVFYVYGFYLPVALVVLLSWVSFWIDPESTPARVSLGVITILAMGNFLHGGGATPQVSYATALDIYIITSFVFVFASLLEYAAVHCAILTQEKESLNEPCTLVKITEAKANHGLELDNESTSNSRSTQHPVPGRNETRKSPLRRKSFLQKAKSKLYYIRFNSRSLESYSRFAFPLLYAIFNAVYWITFYSPSEPSPQDTS